MSIYDEDLPAGGGIFLKIEPGTTVRLRLMTEPIKFVKTFNKETSDRFGAFVVVKTAAADKSVHYEGKAWEFGAGIARPIWTLYRNEDFGDPTGYDLSITRTGSGLDTKYTVVGHPPKELSKDAQQVFSEWKADHGKSLSDVFLKGLNPTHVADEYDEFADD
jgi:hypothetical protein